MGICEGVIMNRRNFLKGTLNGAIALAISPGVVLSEEESGNKFLDENFFLYTETAASK